MGCNISPLTLDLKSEPGKEILREGVEGSVQRGLGAVRNLQQRIEAVIVPDPGGATLQT